MKVSELVEYLRNYMAAYRDGEVLVAVDGVPPTQTTIADIGVGPGGFYIITSSDRDFLDSSMHLYSEVGFALWDADFVSEVI